jgi:hypothetical protein
MTDQPNPQPDDSREHDDAIVRGLTKMQRAAVLDHFVHYVDPNTIRSLRAKGVCSGPRIGLTPLGLAIRARLQEPTS